MKALLILAKHSAQILGLLLRFVFATTRPEVLAAKDHLRDDEMRDDETTIARIV